MTPSVKTPIVRKIVSDRTVDNLWSRADFLCASALTVPQCGAICLRPFAGKDFSFFWSHRGEYALGREAEPQVAEEPHPQRARDVDAAEQRPEVPRGCGIRRQGPDEAGAGVCRAPDREGRLEGRDPQGSGGAPDFAAHQGRDGRPTG